MPSSKWTSVSHSPTPRPRDHHRRDDGEIIRARESRCLCFTVAHMSSQQRTTCVRHVQEQTSQSHSRDEEGRAQEVLPLSEKLMATGSCCGNYKLYRRTLGRTWVQVFFFSLSTWWDSMKHKDTSYTQHPHFRQVASCYWDLELVSDFSQ